MKEFLEKVQPGDVCFCTAETENVIFLEHPSNIHGDLRYNTIDSKIYESSSFCFRIISKGDKCAEYETKDKAKLESYERLARRNGFRIEIEKIEDVYLLKIYGDRQEDVDNFAINLKNDLVLDDY